MVQNYESFIQDHLKYTDEEMKMWMSNPRNLEALEIAPKLLNKTIVLTIVESHGCSSLHHVGQKFYFDGAGNLLTSINPKRICIYALSQMERLIFGCQELFYAGIDPNEMRIKQSGCFDVDLKCGGWGRVIFEISLENRRKVRKDLKNRKL